MSSVAGSFAGSLAGAFFADIGTEGLLDTLGSGGLVDATLATILAAGFAGALAAAFLTPAGAAGLALAEAGVAAFSAFSFVTGGSKVGTSSLCLTSSCSVGMGSATSAMLLDQLVVR